MVRMNMRSKNGDASIANITKQMNAVMIAKVRTVKINPICVRDTRSRRNFLMN